MILKALKCEETDNMFATLLIYFSGFEKNDFELESRKGRTSTGIKQ